MTVQQILGLARPPIAVGLFDEQPHNIKKWGGEVLQVRILAKGMGCPHVFYRPSDHYNYAIGCHTHHIDLSPERKHDTEQTIGLMIKSKYLRMEDIPKIPALKDEPKYIAYGPVEHYSNQVL